MNLSRTTVLEQYQRLEAEGIWRPEPDAQRRDVIVSIGEATLTLSDPNEQVLTHWSLAALYRMNPGVRPAIYTPGADAPDTLEIADKEMIDALQKVLKAIRRGQARPGRLRASILIGATALIVLLMLFWMPRAVTSYTASILPEVAGASIGDDVLSQIYRVTGAPCSNPAGLRALAALETRLFPEATRDIVVLPSALSGTAHLPGGRILVDHRLVEDVDTPNVVANAILAEDRALSSGRSVEHLIDALGVGTAFRLLTTGEVHPEAISSYAETLVASGVALVPNTAAPDDAGPILSDSDWIALQQICEN